MLTISDFSVFVFPYERASSDFSVNPYVETAQRAEELGFYSIAIPHATRQEPSTERAEGPFDPSKPDRLVILDPLLLVPVLAAATKRLRIGLHSAILPLFHPFHWARFFACLDVITGGRVDAGMCVGAAAHEFQSLGIPMNQRGRIADESLEFIVRMWTENEVTYQGRFFQTQGTTIDPKPLQKPHPPVWWGGGTAGVARAARYCQYVLPFAPTPGFVKDELMPKIREESKRWGTKLEVATLLCGEVVVDGRDPEKDILPGYRAFGDLDAHVVGPPERVAQMLKDLNKSGVSHFVLDFHRHGVDPVSKVIAQMELFVDKVMPLLAD